MTNTKLRDSAGSPILSMEQLTVKFAAAASLAGAGFTIPSGAHEIHCQPSAACHWSPVGTATATYAHAVVANEVFVLTNAQHGASIIGDGGAITMTVAYMR